MGDLIRRITYTSLERDSGRKMSDPEDARLPDTAREWLLTNGLGGFASGTLSGIATRRFHGLLVAALPAPRGRTMMLNHLSDRLVFHDGSETKLAAQDRAGSPLAEFRLEAGLPVWRYELAGTVVEKRVVMLYRQNTVHVTYELLSAEQSIFLDLQPWLHFRRYDGPLDAPLDNPYAFTMTGDRYEVAGPDDYPRLKFKFFGAPALFMARSEHFESVRYATEESRGYESMGRLYSPGYFRAELAVGTSVTLIASTEAWETVDALSPALARSSERVRRGKLCAAATSRGADTSHELGAELVFAADQFIVCPAGRIAESARAYASGDDARTVIAGYPWFTDWGRDTMISLEGLTLVTGRHAEAAYILRTFAHYVRDGLIPNMFPDGGCDGLYNTVDASLWFFYAIDRYLEYTGDRETLREILPRLRSIIDHHFKGTRFGIVVDPKDGLLTQGAPGYALTWMDAKVGDFVVTPRRGKAVEINALFYNALRLLEAWEREESGEDAARTLKGQAERARESFNRRFWKSAGDYLYDVVDGEHGDDDAFRPNQLFAISLKYPVLEESRWKSIVDQAHKRLLTPVGIRTLAPGHPDYKSKYFGDLRSRDMAYHQGTVWPWLIGPFIDAYLKVYPDKRAVARGFLSAFGPELDHACVGSISEIHDAEPPYTGRGCVAQAWSVAEVLRCLTKTT